MKFEADQRINECITAVCKKLNLPAERIDVDLELFHVASGAVVSFDSKKRIGKLGFSNLDEVHLRSSEIGITKKFETIKQKLDCKGNKRLMVIEETLVSEETYVRDLEACVNVYLQPLVSRPDLLSSSARLTIFSNIELLASVNKDLLTKLNKCLFTGEAKNPDEVGSGIGDVFKAAQGQLAGAYSVYCNNHPVAVKLLDEQMKKNQGFVKWCEKQKLEVAEARLLGLADFLIKPIQRICKYPLLFRELLKETPERHADHGKIKDCLSALKDVADIVNNRKREVEGKRGMVELNKQLKGYDLRSNPNRTLLMKGPLIKYNKANKGQERYIFMFNDMLMYTKEDRKDRYTYKGAMPLNVCAVSSMEKYQIGGNIVPNVLLVTNVLEKRVFPFACSSPAELQEWYKAASDAISKVDMDTDYDVSRRGRTLRRTGSGTVASIPKPLATTPIPSPLGSPAVASASPAGADNHADLIAKVAKLESKLEHERSQRHELEKRLSKLESALEGEKRHRRKMQKLLSRIKKNDAEGSLSPSADSLDSSSSLRDGEETYQSTAMYDFKPTNEGDMTLKSGDVITLTFYSSEANWWTGFTADGREGQFPSNYVTPPTLVSRS